MLPSRRIEYSNRLPVAGRQDQRCPRRGESATSRQPSHEMMAAGDDLREAKRLVGHGKWLAWLKTNCPDVSERTAHLYMQLAKWRSVVEDAMAKSATIADLERDQA